MSKVRNNSIEKFVWLFSLFNHLKYTFWCKFDNCRKVLYGLQLYRNLMVTSVSQSRKEELRTTYVLCLSLLKDDSANECWLNPKFQDMQGSFIICIPKNISWKKLGFVLCILHASCLTMNHYITTIFFFNIFHEKIMVEK